MFSNKRAEVIELVSDNDQLLVVGVERDPTSNGGYILAANTVLHEGRLTYKSMLAVELAVYRQGARNLPLDATIRLSGPEGCWVFWPGPMPTVELVNMAIEQLQTDPLVLQICEYPSLPGCLLLRSSDRIGECLLSFIEQAPGVERAVPLRDSPYYDQLKTLVVTTDVRFTSDQVAASIREAVTL